MSAFLVNPEHIHVLVWAAGNLGGRGHDFYTTTSEEPSPSNAVVETDDGRRHRVLARGLESAFGQLLLDANAISVNALYRENEAYVYDYRPPRRKDWGPVDILKALSCYAYQSCEYESWESSEAKQFCDLLTIRMIQALPGYRQASWEISSESVPAHVEDGR